MGFGGHARLVFQYISSVEELADVTTDMEVYQKLTAWVVSSKALHIKNHIVENAELFAAANPVVKVFTGYNFINLSERLFLFLIDLEKYFEGNNEYEEDYSFDND